MKKILTVALIVVSAAICRADISIQYSTSSAVRWWNGASLANLPSGALVQLIWSADSSYATPVFGSIPVAGGQYADGDYVLYSANTTVVGGFTDTQMDGATTYQNADVGGQNVVNGYVYVYIFQDGIVNLGDYYGRSSVIGGPLNDVTGSPPASPNVLNVSPSPGLVIGPVSQGGQGLQVVPEPSSMALLGVGLALVAWRRMARK